LTGRKSPAAAAATVAILARNKLLSPFLDVKSWPFNLFPSVSTWATWAAFTVRRKPSAGEEWPMLVRVGSTLVHESFFPNRIFAYTVEWL